MSENSLAKINQHSELAPCWFAEARYFSGGYTSLCLELETRPSWAPPPDTVGFRGEVSTQPGDYVVELSKVNFNSRQITWVAVYQADVDHIYGDRGNNYSGVGIWVVDGGIRHYEQLLNALKVLSGSFKEHKSLDRLHANARKARKDKYIQEYLFSMNSVHDFSVGLSSSVSPIHNTKCFTIKGREKSAWSDASLFLQKISLLGLPDKSVSRCLLFIHNVDTVLSVGPGVEISELPKVDVANVLEKIPEILGPLSLIVGDLKIKNDALQNSVNHLTTENDFFRQQSTSIQVEKDAILNDKLSFENSRKKFQLEQELEKRRLESIDDLPPTIEGVARRLNKLSSQIDDLKSIAMQLNSPIPKPSQKEFPDRPYDNFGTHGKSTSVSAKADQRNFHRNSISWKKILDSNFVVLFCLFIVFILIGFMIYRHVY